MFEWSGKLLAKLFQRKKANVTFNERERVDPVLHLVKDASFIIGDVRVVEQIVQRREPHSWVPVCYLPKHHEVTQPEHLPVLAPFGYRYVINNVDWTFDGTAWVRNVTDTGAWKTAPIPRVTQRVQPMSPPQHVSPMMRHGADPHPTDNGIMMTAMAMHVIDSGSSNSSSSCHSSSSRNHCSTDDSPSYDSGDGGGSCD